MKILKKGIIPDNTPINETCYNCKTEFEYTKKDVQSDSRDGDYVICPVCKKFISSKSFIPIYRNA